MRFLNFALVLLVGFQVQAVAAKTSLKKTPKKPVAVEPADWVQAATAELEAARNEVAKPEAKSKKAAKQTNAVGDTSTAKPVEDSQPRSLTDTTTSDGGPSVLPSAATVRAEVNPTQSVIARSALRFTFLFEPYQPNGTATLGSGQKLSYNDLPTSVLGQVDLRWLPFDAGDIRGRPVVVGGYVAGGYARQTVPLVAPSGFRYDDVALNTLRFEAGATTGLTLGQKWNLEGRLGVGRLSVIQTSKYSDVVGSFERPYLVGALDLAYHVWPRFAFVGSVARRTPIGDGSGALAFDPLTVSGGFLVQVR